MNTVCRLPPLLSSGSWWWVCMLCTWVTRLVLIRRITRLRSHCAVFSLHSSEDHGHSFRTFSGHGPWNYLQYSQLSNHIFLCLFLSIYNFCFSSTMSKDREREESTIWRSMQRRAIAGGGGQRIFNPCCYTSVPIIKLSCMDTRAESFKLVPSTRIHV